MNDFYSVVRCIDDQFVAERLIEIWPSIKLLVKFWQSFPKSKRPSFKSYEVVVETVADPLVVAKLRFCSYVASLLKPYLKKFLIRTANDTLFEERVITTVLKCFGDDYSTRYSE